MAKKKDALTGSADASVLRRLGRETPSRKQTTSSPVNSRRSPRIEKHTSPNPSPVKNKLEKIEKQTVSSPLRRSDRGKKLVEIADSANIKSTKEKTANNSKQSSEDASKDKKTEMQDPEGGGRKRKKIDAIRYKALFKTQRILADTDADKEPKSQNSIRVQGAPDNGHKVIDLDPIEHGACPQTKSLDGKSIESGDAEKNNGDDVLPANGNIANSGNMSHTSSHRLENDLENQQEHDTCHKVTETCKAAGSMENEENNDVTENMQNSKFVEFWVPVQLSNVQLEQYCATLLSNDVYLRSRSKGDTLGALENIFITNRKCCNHPFTVDLKVEQSIIKDKDPVTVVDVGAQASGKLQFLDHVLPEIQKQKLKVLILFQPTSGVSSGNISLGNLLVEFVVRRFGQNSYELVDGLPNISSKKQAAINKFNKDVNKFIFLLESRACHQSIKLSRVDAIIIFDTELNPSNDVKSLQKLSIDSQSEQVMIFRLYSLSTLEEKILKLAETNVAVDIRSQKLRSNYDALLTWGASDLFDKLTEFHSQNAQKISSEESFLKDVVEEFLYILSHKCKINDTTSKSVITRVQNCGTQCKNCEIKTHLPDGDQPYIFWEKLLEGRCPVWKFVAESTPRQRKRPSNFLEGKGGAVKIRRKTVNNSAIEAAKLKTVTEGESGVNEGDSPTANESQSSSVDRFWSTKVNDEPSLLDFMKPTVSELCNILKFSEDVKITVERFLEYVVENFKVSKDPTSVLQAFMISLCFVGSSLAKNKINRSESFALAKRHLNFSCDEEQVESVYGKLKQIKGKFLAHTQVCPAVKDSVSAPEGVKLGVTKSQHIINVDVSGENVSKKGVEEFEKINSEWDEKRAIIENDYNVDKAIIYALYSKNLSRRSEKLKKKEIEFANKLKEHDSQKRLWEATIQRETRVGPSGNAEVAISLPENTVEVQSHDERVCEGANDIESTGSHTSEKEMVDAVVSSEQLGEVPAQPRGDDMEVDVADKVDCGHENAKGGTVEDHNETGASDVALHVDCGDVEMPDGNDNKEKDEDGTVGPDENDHSKTCANDVAPHVDSGDVEMPAGNDNKENDDDGTVDFDENDHNETDANDMGMPAGNYNKENDENGTVGLDTSHVVKDCHETADDVAPEDESAEMATPAGTCDKESPEEGEIQPEDHHETVDDVVPEVESADIANPAGTCDKESPEEGEIHPDGPGVGDNHIETSPNDVLPHVESAELAIPVDKVNAEDSIIRPDTLHANEDHNDSCGSKSGNPVCAAISQDNTPSVQPISSPASDHIDPVIPDSGVQDEDINVGNLQLPGVNQLDQMILDDEANIPSSIDPVCAAISQDKTPSVQPVSSPASDHEIQNGLLQLEQLPDSGVQDEEINIGSLQPSGASQPDQIILDVEPDIPSSTAQTVAEESTVAVPQSGENLEENPVPASDTPREEQQPRVATSVAPAPPVNPLGMFDNLTIRGNPQMPFLTDPLEAEIKRLKLVKDNVTKLHQEMKQWLDTEFKKEKEEAIARITLKYEAKHLEADATCNSKKMELETNINRVILNRVLAEAFRSKCQDLTPSGHPVSQAGLMQNLQRLPGLPSLGHYHGSPSSSPGQSSGNQLPPPPPPQPPQPQLRPQPPLQIVHQPAALFSSTPSRSPSSTLYRPPSTTSYTTTPSRPPLVVNQMTYSTLPTTTRLPPIVNEATTSTTPTPSRPPPIVNQATSSTTPTTSRLPPIVDQVTSSTTPPTIRLPPIVDQVTSSTTPTTIRLPHIVDQVTSASIPTTTSRSPIVNQVTSTSIPTTTSRSPIVNQVTSSTTPTTSRPPPGINVSSLSALHNKRPPSISQIDMSAANLRISTETRGQSPHINRPLVGSEPRAPAPSIRPLVNSGPRAPAPHINRPLVGSEPRAPAPSIRPLVNSGPRAPAPHLRPMVNREPRAPAPHLRSIASTEIRSRAPHMQPFRSTPSVTPDVGTQRRVLPSQHVTSGPSQSPVMPPLSSSPTPQPPPSEPSAQTRLGVIDLDREGTARASSAEYVVCLSDDD